MMSSRIDQEELCKCAPWGVLHCVYRWECSDCAQICWCTRLINEAPGVPHTGQDNCVPVLCVSGLKCHHTVQVRRLMLIHVAVMIWQELNDLQLLVGRQYVQ